MYRNKQSVLPTASGALVTLEKDGTLTHQEAPMHPSQGHGQQVVQTDKDRSDFLQVNFLESTIYGGR